MIKPIQLSTILVSKTDQNFTSNNKSEQHTDFKATLLNNNNNNYSKNYLNYKLPHYYDYSIPCGWGFLVLQLIEFQQNGVFSEREL